MISDLDQTIRQVLLEAGGFDPAEVDVSFKIPNREWSAGISKPTLNCYLFDIHERRLLREDGWQTEGRGSRASARRSPPLFFNFNYLITAWTSEVEDEHRLLWQVLETLMDLPVLPEEYLQGELKNHEWPVHTMVAQLEGVLKSPGEFWTALENQIKPSLSYIVTLGRARQPRPTNAPPVLSTGIRLSLPESTATEGFQLGAIFRLPPDLPHSGIKISVEGQSISAVSDEQGRFGLDGLAPGSYMLVARIGDRDYRRSVLIRDRAARSQRPRYSDRIYDQDGQPLGGIVVEVEGSNLRTVTDAEGRFNLDLPPGRHVLRIKFDGWSQRRQISVRDPGYQLMLHYGGRPFDQEEP